MQTATAWRMATAVAVKVCDIVPRDVADTLPTLVRQQLDGIAQWQ